MKLELLNFGKKFVMATKRHAPTIMSIGAGIGVGATVYFALKAKPKVDDIWAENKAKIEEIRKKADEENKKKESKEQKSQKELEYSIRDEIRQVRWSGFKKAARASSKAVIAGVMTEAMIFGSNALNLRKIADISALADMYAKMNKQYMEATKETVGEKKAQEVKEAYAKKRYEESVAKDPRITDTGFGTVLYLDEWTGEKYYASYNAHEAARNDINERLNNGEEYVSVNEYRKLLHRENCKFGEENGWCPTTGLLYLEYTAIITDDGQHCIMVSYDTSKDFKKNTWGEYVY